jgi:hypothetical protein
VARNGQISTETSDSVAGLAAVSFAGANEVARNGQISTETSDSVAGLAAVSFAGPWGAQSVGIDTNPAPDPLGHVSAAATKVERKHND